MGRTFWTGVGLLLALGAGAMGCGSGRTIQSGLSAEGISLARDVQPILSATCGFSPCHGGSSPQLGMDLSDGQTFANTVNVASVEVPDLMRVKPGDSANSYLYQKISQDTPAEGTRMPQTGTISAQDIELIRRWIDGGAQP